MACCGQNRSQRPTMGPLGRLPADSTPGATATPPGARNLAQFEYLGKTALTAIGPVTGRRYRFQGRGARVAVDARDAAGMIAVPNLRPV